MKANLIRIFFQMGWLKPATRKWFLILPPISSLCYVTSNPPIFGRKIPVFNRFEDKMMDRVFSTWKPFWNLKADKVKISKIFLKWIISSTWIIFWLFMFPYFRAVECLLERGSSSKDHEARVCGLAPWCCHFSSQKKTRKGRKPASALDNYFLLKKLQAFRKTRYGFEKRNQCLLCCWHKVRDSWSWWPFMSYGWSFTLQDGPSKWITRWGWFAPTSEFSISYEFRTSKLPKFPT